MPEKLPGQCRITNCPIIFMVYAQLEIKYGKGNIPDITVPNICLFADNDYSTRSDPTQALLEEVATGLISEDIVEGMRNRGCQTLKDK